jgi:nucleotide-binding universal stress UspA family protein
VTEAVVIAAIDLGPSSARVLYHAAGFARLWSARLVVLHVDRDASDAGRQRVVDFCTRQGSYEIDPDGLEVTVRQGHVSEAIYREAQRTNAALVVMGSRGRGGLVELLLGSSCGAVLRSAAAPVLLVPPIDVDIVNLSDRAVLTCGPVLAAVDLAEPCARQLELAAELSVTAGQKLLLMTVAPRRLDDHAAGVMLRERGHAMGKTKPHAMIVRRGIVAEEITRCAVQENAGLVVMGLRKRPRGTPGVIASAVLKTHRAFVLAVPGCEEP